jgi:hypothetical protein
MGYDRHPRQPNHHEQQQGASSTHPKASSRLDGSMEDMASVPASTMNYPLRQIGQEKRDRQRQLQNSNAPTLAPFRWAWNGNKQGATNSDTPYDPTVTFEGAYPTEYWCDNYLPFAKTDEIYVVGETEVSFDVEASFDKATDLESNVRALEWSVLDSVVTHIGLDVCKFDLQREKQGSRGLLMGNRDDFMAMVQPSAEEHLHRRTQILTYPTVIYRLSSMPPDQIGAPGRVGSML